MQRRTFIVGALGLLVSGVLLFLGRTSTVLGATEGPIIMVSPASATAEIGETFDVHSAINTTGQSINAFKIKLRFQPDKLQVVSPGIGQSVAGLWVRRPSYSNETGEIELEGAIPSPGINTAFGILTTVTFRAKSLGQTTLRFSDESALYLNDGQGTSVDKIFQNGLYRLTLPAPQGPVITSPTHPDQDKWYSVNDVVLRWNNTNPIEGYSYILNQTPIDVPDNISDGGTPETTYKGLADGIYYFHVKALRDGVWGGTSHFGVKIQTGSPARFEIEVTPSQRTSSKTVILNFETTDQLSGMDHYEMKVIRLDAPENGKMETGNPFFFETRSPHVFRTEDFGKYQFIVRAYNQAGNYTESSVKVSIVEPLFRFVTEAGLKVGDTVISWFVFWALILALIIALWYLMTHVFRWHLHLEFHYNKHHDQHASSTRKLQELRQRLGSSKTIALLMTVGLAWTFTFGASPTRAAQLAPPVTNTISENINNDEIFYVGGRAAAGSEGRVIIYLESTSTGETFSFEVPVNDSGEWFYTHTSFLQGGTYLLWTQLKVGEVESAPSGQIQMIVSPKAIQLGASRLSYETIYLGIIMVGFVLMSGLIGAILYYWRKGRRRHRNLFYEIRQAEDAVRHGFVVLERDIRSELDVLHGLMKGQEVSAEQKAKEQQLLNDLEEISTHISKEVFNIERSLGSRA